ncbi:MAG: hypothetical protein HYV09_19790 [Deltaproteobacteria bacterium]|nr:hypothetical protein [Deltaproteobacteria bacterium]
MRRAFFCASVVSLCAFTGCQGDDAHRAPAGPSSVSAPIEVVSTARGGQLLRHTRKRFAKGKTPFLGAPGVQGFQRVGDTFVALPFAPRGRLPSASVELPEHADGAARVRSGGVEVVVRPKLAHVAAEWAQDFAIHPEVAPATTMFRRVDEGGLDDVFEVGSPRETLTFTYQVSTSGAGGLRLVGDTLEVVDRDGAPRLRMPAPIVADANGDRRTGTIEVRGCAVDRDARGPWGRAPVAPGAESCEVVASIDGRGLAYPVLVDPAWEGTVNTKRSHAYHRMLKIGAGADSGKILLVGGTGSEPTYTELFDPATKTWAAASALSDSLGMGMNAVALPDGTVVAAGGFPTTTGTTAKSNAYVRSPTTGTWSGAASLSVGRAWFAMHAARIDGKDVALVAGGMQTTSTSTKPLKTVEYYDAVTDSWFTGASMSEERSHAGSAVLSDGRVLVVGGHGYTTSSTQLATAEVFDPATKTWAGAGTLITKRSDGVVLALPSGRAVVAGGWNSMYDTLATVEYFDGTAWSEIAGKGMTEPRMFHVGAQLTDGRILFAAGNKEPDDPKWAMTPTNTADLLVLGSDPKTTAKIVGTANLNVARIAPAGIAIGDTVLVTGGLTADSDGSETTSSELFDGTLGAACSTASPCPTGLFCTEGVCCKSASCAEGQTCAAAGFEGVCTKPKGASCTANSDCATGYCVTGVCCATACTGDCESCNTAGKVGDCVAAAVGTDPKGKCGGDPSCGPFCDSWGDCWEYAAEGTTCGASLGDAGTGLFCTKYACDEWGDCMKSTHDCGLTCTTTVSCDEATKTCTATASGIKAGQCVIDGQCWAYGDVNPKDACQLCDPPASKTSWSVAASCTDGGTDTGIVEEDAAPVTDTGASSDTGTTAKDTGTTVEDSGSAEDSGTDDATTDGGGPGAGADLPEASTCSCELPGRGRSEAPFAAIGLALAIAAARRRGATPRRP